MPKLSLAPGFFLGTCGLHPHLFDRCCLSPHGGLAGQRRGLGDDRSAPV